MNILVVKSAVKNVVQLKMIIYRKSTHEYYYKTLRGALEYAAKVNFF